MRRLRALSWVVLLAVSACLVMVLRAGPAEAHAIIVESTPATGSTMGGPEIDIRLRFNSRLDHERSRLSLLRPDGSVEPLEVARDGPPEILPTHAGGLAPGSYRLRWQVLAIDGHITRGEIPFRVADR